MDGNDDILYTVVTLELCQLLRFLLFLSYSVALFKISDTKPKYILQTCFNRHLGQCC